MACRIKKVLADFADVQEYRNYVKIISVDSIKIKDELRVYVLEHQED
jgi:hypothetical protein